MNPRPERKNLFSFQKSLASILLALTLGGSFGLAVYDPSCRTAFMGMSTNICGLLIRVIADSSTKK